MMCATRRSPLMLAGGADLKATSEVAGHDNVSITQNVYQKTYRDQRVNYRCQVRRIIA